MRTEWRRELDWWLKARLRWSAPVFKRRLRDPERLRQRLDAAAVRRWRELASRYDLSRWVEVCSLDEYRECLAVLDLLDRHAGAAPASGRGLDIGSKNGSYLPALVTWHGGGWDGIEIDAHLRYWNLATRRGWAESMLRPWPDCRYIAGSLLDLDPDASRYAVVTWFLPFVTPTPFIAWGLPRRFFMPQRMLEHAWRLLAPGGRMLVVNQGEAEAEAQQGLFEVAGIAATGLGEVGGVFDHPSMPPRYGWLVERTV
ncbi:MAG: hypothetical protein PHQ14_04570 [Chromatiales bacterium]|nr:hypothetical protein [Chromatiales bacterium]MDX9766763.1 hypothetical protein [Ectothiorhodospiraceae bacterium]